MVLNGTDEDFARVVEANPLEVRLVGAGLEGWWLRTDIDSAIAEASAQQSLGSPQKSHPTGA